jgi:hypothetical protein
VSDVEARADDSRPFHPGYGHGGVPWYLLVFYLAFLVFFVWCVVEYQLPDYLEKGPIQPGVESPQTPP